MNDECPITRNKVIIIDIVEWRLTSSKQRVVYKAEIRFTNIHSQIGLNHKDRSSLLCHVRYSAGFAQLWFGKLGFMPSHFMGPHNCVLMQRAMR